MTRIDERHPVLAVGLMSGTSMDGIDVALIRTDGRTVSEFLSWRTLPYGEGFRPVLRSVLGGTGDVPGVERHLTDLHAMATEQVLWLAQANVPEVRVVGFHGHTILHRPEEGATWQIGDGDRLANRLGIDVVTDFRTADVKAGGQGAPLVPIYHAALAEQLERPIAIVNIGGIANVTWIGENPGELLAFDTGPGNALIDDWMINRAGYPMDVGGEAAATGRVEGRALDLFLSHPFFQKTPPKSLDRSDFSIDLIRKLKTEDGAATLAAFTVAAIARGAVHFPEPPRQWLVCGGGRHNRAIMAGLNGALSAPVKAVEAVGWHGDALEAEAFAFLAVRALRGLPISFPETTNVAHPMTGGTVHPVLRQESAG